LKAKPRALIRARQKGEQKLKGRGKRARGACFKGQWG
jgi:hypothetical protein